MAQERSNLFVVTIKHKEDSHVEGIQEVLERIEGKHPELNNEIGILREAFYALRIRNDSLTRENIEHCEERSQSERDKKALYEEIARLNEVQSSELIKSQSDCELQKRMIADLRKSEGRLEEMLSKARANLETLQKKVKEDDAKWLSDKIAITDGYGHEPV